MANFLINNLFRIAVNSLNFASPSIVADILLHPIDFATVLLQIGFDPEGIKCHAGTLFSVILQYSLFTLYIPYLLTTAQGLHLMGMPHPSIFYYVGYIYKKEGLSGCYRGILPKILERMIMVGVNERVKQKMSKGSVGLPDDADSEDGSDLFLQTLMNAVCSHFFAVLVSHPFHVLMVSSFAEFTCGKRSSFADLFRSIYSDEGYFGFFTGLTARLLGELLSLTFSVVYTAIINTQLSPQRPNLDARAQPNTQTATHFVNYVTDVSRFTAFKQPRLRENRSGNVMGVEGHEEVEGRMERRRREFQAQNHFFLYDFFRNVIRSLLRPSRSVPSNRRPGLSPILAYVPLTSKLFYYIMIRDFLSKKISTPFFLVCHCAIVLDTGWDKFPLLGYLKTLAPLIQRHLIPAKRTRSHRCKTKDSGKF